VFLLLAGCTQPSSDTLDFIGVWNVVRENGIAGQSTPSTIYVSVGQRRFRIEQRAEERSTVMLYDGERLFKSDEPPVAKSNTQMDAWRFWKRNFAGNSVSGGKIAGRETVLFQSQDTRPTDQITVQAWVDAETGVILKKIFTIYSRQLEQVTTRDTEECVAINYGPVNDTVFSKL